MSEYQDDGIIDVERRRRSIEYSFGDPTLFPPEFLNWLKRFIEQSGIELPASSIFGLTGGAGSLKNFQPGLIVPYAGATAPPGSLPADGQQVNKADYPELWKALGDTWGVSTATQFFLPDLRDRALYGAGPQVPVGTTDGKPLNSRGPWHHHNVNLATTNAGNHSHTGSVSGDGSHSHSGQTAMAGDHAHAPSVGSQFATSQETTAALGSGGSVRYIVAGAAPTTSVDGSHLHSFSASGGGHGHGLSISGVGDHNHTASGATSGAGQLDVGGFAAILYVITTG